MASVVFFQGDARTPSGTVEGADPGLGKGVRWGSPD